MNPITGELAAPDATGTAVSPRSRPEGSLVQGGRSSHGRRPAPARRATRLLRLRLPHHEPHCGHPTAQISNRTTPVRPGANPSSDAGRQPSSRRTRSATDRTASATCPALRPAIRSLVRVGPAPLTSSRQPANTERVPRWRGEDKPLGLSRLLAGRTTRPPSSRIFVSYAHSSHSVRMCQGAEWLTN
jgi:hypothetical protein